jgi:hypothetical protein
LIRVTENGETNYRDIIVFDKTLDIKTNIKFSILVWVKTNWQWFMVIILIPLVKWLYELYKGRKNNNNNNGINYNIKKKNNNESKK